MIRYVITARAIHSGWRCQPSGRCKVMCRRPWRAPGIGKSRLLAAAAAFARDAASRCWARRECSPRRIWRLRPSSDRLSLRAWGRAEGAGLRASSWP